jgi:hypothetical protein
MDSIQEARLALAERLAQTASTAKLQLFHLLGLPVSPQHLLGRRATLPLVQWNNTTEHMDLEQQQQQQPQDEMSRTTQKIVSLQPGQLKEVAIPTTLEQSLSSSTSLFSKLSSLERAATGLYRFPDAQQQFCLRPLPVGKQDLHLAPPSLIFHVQSLEKALSGMLQPKPPSTITTIVERIGYNGTQNAGQVVLRHPCFHGLDIRLCESVQRRSMFHEAQESLLAGSLPELQSKHVLVSQQQQQIPDPRTNEADCWVEFRATMRHPSGFVARKLENRSARGRT